MPLEHRHGEYIDRRDPQSFVFVVGQNVEARPLDIVVKGHAVEHVERLFPDTRVRIGLHRPDQRPFDFPASRHVRVRPDRVDGLKSRPHVVVVHHGLGQNVADALVVHGRFQPRRPDDVVLELDFVGPRIDVGQANVPVDHSAAFAWPLGHSAGFALHPDRPRGLRAHRSPFRSPEYKVPCEKSHSNRGCARERHTPLREKMREPPCARK